MTAEQNLRLVCDIKGSGYEKVAEKLEVVGLTDRKDSKFRTFSLGMKQRLAIASALLNDPEILILDEPTNGLDPQGIHQIRDIIRKIASQGTTILLASHLLDEVEKVCSHVLVLRKGEILYSGTVDGLTEGEQFLEICADDMPALAAVLPELPGFARLAEDNGKFTVYFNGRPDASAVNRYLAGRNIFASHLSMRRNTLEEQFLAITNTTKA